MINRHDEKLHLLQLRSHDKDDNCVLAVKELILKYQEEERHFLTFFTRSLFHINNSYQV